MKFAWMIVALCGTSALAEPITYRTTGASAGSVVNAVAVIAGEKWAIDRELSGEIVAISVNRIEPADFRVKLAQVLSGKWVKKDDGTLLLEDDPTQTRKRHEVAQKAFVASIRSRVETMISDLEKVAFSEGSLVYHELSRLQPLYILRQISDRVLEDLEVGDRVVLSTQPTRMQQSLPNVLPKINELGAEIARRQHEERKQQQPDIVILYRPREVTSCTFAIERFSYENIGLTYGYGISGSGYQIVGTIFKQPVRKGTGVRIDWSPVATEISRLFRSGTPASSYGVAPLSERAISVLRDPVANDPLSFAFGEGILACATSQGKNVIASMPDDDFSSQLGFARDGMTTDDFMEAIAERTTLTVDSSEDWLLVHPSDPHYAREFRGNRFALKALINSVSGGMYPSLNAISKFAASNLVLWRNSVPFRHIMATVVGSDGGGATPYAYNEPTWRGLQLFESLGPAARARLQKGEQIPIGSLPLPSKEVLTSLVFGAPQQFGEHPEPTTVMPHGLPNNARLRAEVTSEPILAPMPDGGELSTPSLPLGPQIVARIRIDGERNEPTISLHRVRLGERTVWKFALVGASDEVIRRATVCEDRVDPKGKVMLISDLPESVKKTLDEAERLERIRLFGGWKTRSEICSLMRSLCGN